MPPARAATYEDVSVLFCDIVGFTAYSEKHPPETVFAELASLVDRFEQIAQQHGLEKIICGRPPPAKDLKFASAKWSGAVICPALWCGTS
jgi:hypothetical protein